jgi:hypothetical protein
VNREKLTKPLDIYEQAIADKIHEQFNRTLEDAYELVIRYRNVINKVGRYDNAEDWAERLVEAVEKEWTPDKWLAHINEWHKKLHPEISATKPKPTIIVGYANRSKSGSPHSYVRLAENEKVHYVKVEVFRGLRTRPSAHIRRANDMVGYVRRTHNIPSHVKRTKDKARHDGLRVN